MSFRHPYIGVTKYVETIARVAYNKNDLTFDVVLSINERYDKSFLPEYVFISTGFLSRKVYKLVFACDTNATYCEAHHVHTYEALVNMSKNYHDISLP